MPTQVLRFVHVGFVLVLGVPAVPRVAARFRNRLMPWDVLLQPAAIVTIAYLLLGGDEFCGPQHVPEHTDASTGLGFA